MLQILFDREIFGTCSRDIFYDGEQIQYLDGTEKLGEHLYLHREILEEFHKLFGIEDIEFPEDKWRRVYSILLSGEVHYSNVPWSMVIPGDEYREAVSRYCERIYRQISYIDLKYYGKYREYDYLFQNLSPTRVNSRACFHHMESSTTSQREILKGFIPRDGYAATPKYSRIDSLTGRLIIESGPNILLLKREYRDILQSRFGEQGRIVYLDYSSLEPRILLSIMKQEEAGKLPRDIYRKFMEDNSIVGLERDTVKVALISQLYGANEDTLIRQLHGKIHSPRELIEAIKEYFGIEELRLVLRERWEASENKHIQNYYNRYIFCEDAKPYVLLNYYIQSTAVDVALQGFNKIVKKIKDSGIDDVMVPLFVLHDALLLDVHEDAYDSIEKLCRYGSRKIPGFEDVDFFLNEQALK